MEVLWIVLSGDRERMYGLFGSKPTSGLCQPLIAMMPPHHDTHIETHPGGGAKNRVHNYELGRFCSQKFARMRRCEDHGHKIARRLS